MTALLSEYGLWVLGALLGAGAVLGAAVGEAVRRRRDPLRARDSASSVRVTGRLRSPTSALAPLAPAVHRRPP